MTKKSILVTGGAGFIGSNFIEYFSKKYPHYDIINIDKLTYAGNVKNLSSIQGKKNYTFYQEDICDDLIVNRIFKDHKIDSVIHFAAESHVDNSISSPLPFIKTNIQGT